METNKKKIRFDKGEVVEYRLNQSNQIKRGEIIEANHHDNGVSIYVITDGPMKKVGDTPCYVVCENDILSIIN